MSRELFEELELFIFDMDGLLFDTESVYIDQGKKIAKNMGFTVTDEITEKVTGVSNELERRIFLEEFGEEFDFDLYMSTMYSRVMERAEKSDIPLMKGAEEILRFLKENNKKIALGTSADSIMADKLLKSQNIHKYFDLIVTSDDTSEGKPSPEIFLKSAEKFNTDPGKAMVFEDSFNGIRAAHAAGMYPVMIPDKLYPDKETEKILFKKFDSLLDAIEFFKK